MILLVLASLAQPIPTTDDVDRVSLVIVQPGPKRHFLKEAFPCPAGGAQCRRRAYVLPGDALVTFGRRGALSLVEFVDRRGRATSGWIETAALVPISGRATASWSGEWSRPFQRIQIAGLSRRGSYRLSGDATWQLSKDSSPHYGKFDVTVSRPHKGLAFAVDVINYEPLAKALPYKGGQDGRCRIRMRRLGPYLVVHDNARRGGYCGGHGVSFLGIYRQIVSGSQPLPSEIS